MECLLKMTKNFKKNDFTCKCGCGYNIINPVLVNNLQIIRDIIKESININSGCRCPEHNKNVGGAPDSFHVKGMAADLSCKQTSPVKLYEIINDKFPNCYGLILYDTFVHFDIRQYKFRQINLKLNSTNLDKSNRKVVICLQLTKNY